MPTFWLSKSGLHDFYETNGGGRKLRESYSEEKHGKPSVMVLSSLLGLRYWPHKSWGSFLCAVTWRSATSVNQHDIPLEFERRCLAVSYQLGHLVSALLPVVSMFIGQPRICKHCASLNELIPASHIYFVMNIMDNHVQGKVGVHCVYIIYIHIYYLLSIYLLILSQKHKPPWRGGSNEPQQSMF